MADKNDHGTAPVGSNNPKAKLDDDKVREIHRRRSAGEEGKTLAQEFGVSCQTISHIMRGRSWSHVTGTTYGF